jgi:hypothetical protein
MSDRLVREGNPPSGRIASPVPQYWNSVLEEYEKAQGSAGAIRIQALTETIADLKSLLDAFVAEDFASEETLGSLKTSTGATDDAVVDAGAVGTLQAKMRRLSTDLGALLTAFNSKDFATQTTLSALLTAFNNEDFASETTLDALLTAFGAEDFASQTTLAEVKVALDGLIARDTSGSGAPSYDGEPEGYSYLDFVAGDLYFSNGSAWVKVLEGIWA